MCKESGEIEYRKKIESVLKRLIERERVYSKVSGVTFGFIRYKRAMKELLQHEGRIEHANDLIAVKHIGKAIIDAIKKELDEAGPTSTRASSENEEIKEEEIIIVDHSMDSINAAEREEGADAHEKKKDGSSSVCTAKNDGGIEKDAFSDAYTKCNVQIKLKKKQTGHVFSLKTKEGSAKIPVPFTLCHLMVLSLSKEASPGKFTDMASVRYLSLERARRNIHIYGSKLLFESTEKRIKHSARILMRHGLIEETPSGLCITDAGKVAAGMLERMEMHQEQYRKYISTDRDSSGSVSVDINSSRDSQRMSENKNMLLIDIREKRTREDPYFFHTFLSHAGVASETRVLSIGDFLWAHIDNMQEYYSNVLMERKTIRDLLQSVRDGRYREQKERLQRLPGKKMYCLEGGLPADKTVLKMFYTATFGLAAKGFVVLNPWKIEETLSAIETLSKHISKKTAKKDFLLEGLLMHSHKKKLTDYPHADRSLIVLQAISGISYGVAASIIKTVGGVQVLIEKGKHPTSLLEELASVPSANRKRTLGHAKAQRILDALGL
ncbi:hypothetical protein NEMIN01_1651 [Nematocida minor]|uniref:uncharacterized protein n=1 Tax=Nematocida minor TaxID=1912983 RepID=UPI00221F969C|nr:uncharacterized protein NEMIN01_1651 [Nematocida minor]KAI5191760.1 hypothetical protein NEMIN01_1651 [Nematocida minor]